MSADKVIVNLARDLLELSKSVLMILEPGPYSLEELKRHINKTIEKIRKGLGV